MVLQSKLMQTNGTIDTFYKYKDRVIPSKPQCSMPNAMCPPSKICKPGFQMTKKLHGMFCCPDPRSMVLPKAQQPCYPVAFGFAYDIKPHPQTHDTQTFFRDRNRKRHGGGGALHQNKVVEPVDTGMGLFGYLLIGGAGYLGYKYYKKHKRKAA